MARSRQQGPRRVSTFGGLVMLAIPGLALGALAGVVWEDPGLVAAYLFGATDEVAWAPGGGETLPPVAAPPDSVPAEVETPPPVSAKAPVAKPAPAPRKTSPPAAKPAPRVSPPVAAVTGSVAIQVGAFSERAGADRLADQLRGKGFPVVIVPGDGASALRWRVRVGPLGSREEAETTAVRLKRDEKLPTWIVDVAG